MIKRRRDNMGFQKMCDTSQQDANQKANDSSCQRTSVTAKEANNTSKCQYGRLSASGKKEGE